jgi:hypothetical protein
MPLGLHIGLRLGQPLARESAYVVETRRVLARWAALGVPASAARAAALDTFVRAMKTGGVWAKFDVLYLLAAHARAAARVNLANPGTFDATEVDAANLAFTTDRGFTSNGSSSYLQTNLNPTVGTLKFLRDNASLSVWSLTDSDISGAEIGNGTVSRLISRNSGSLSSRANSGTTGPTTVADSLGLIGWSRDASDHQDNFKGASIVGSPVAASAALTNAVFRVCTSASTYSTRQLALAAIGGEVASVLPAYHAAALAYMQAVGASA